MGANWGDRGHTGGETGGGRHEMSRGGSPMGAKGGDRRGGIGEAFFGGSMGGDRVGAKGEDMRGDQVEAGGELPP